MFNRISDFVWEMGGKGSGRRKSKGPSPSDETNPLNKEKSSGETTPPNTKTPLPEDKTNLSNKEGSSGEINPSSSDETSISVNTTDPPAPASPKVDDKKGEGGPVQKIPPATMADRKRRTSKNYVFPNEKDKDRNN
jgi:hypothetical protein